MIVAELEPEVSVEAVPADPVPAVEQYVPDRDPTDARRRRRYVWLVLGCLATVFLWTLPWLISATGIHNRFLPKVPGFSVTASSVELGWFSPTIVHGLQVQEKGTKPKPKRAASEEESQEEAGDSVTAEKVEVNRSFFDLVRGKLKDSTITLRKPHFRLSLTDASSVAKAIPQIRTKVVDARLTLLNAETKEPLIDLPNLNFVARTKATKTGKVLTVEPSKILDHHEIKPELFTKGLEFVAPLLADAAKVSGSVTVEVRKCVVRFEGDKPIVDALDGRVVLHDVQSTATGTTADVVQLLGTALRMDVPQQLRVVDDSVVDFEVIDGRVHHKGLAFLLPGITDDLLLTSAGTVGFDRSLEVTLSVNLPRKGLADYPLLQRLADQPLELALTGTIDNPTLGIARNQTLIDVLASRLAPTPDGRPEPVPDAVLRLVNGLGQARPQVPGEPSAVTGSILNLIRSVQEQRRRAGPLEEVSPRPRRRPIRRPRMNRRRFPPGKNPPAH